jgi:SNF family Na+-dependent transporter
MVKLIYPMVIATISNDAQRQTLACMEPRSPPCLLKRRTLPNSDTPDNPNLSISVTPPSRWQLALCLLASWVIIFLTLVKGLKAYGKVAYVVTLSPYFVLTALMIYAVQLPGASDGIYFYLKPEWNKLLEIDIWAKAASQEEN